MNNTTDLFTPAPGTKFRFGKLFTLVALRVEGTDLICEGTEAQEGQVFAVSEEDRRSMEQIDMVTPA